jgi:hypothetical protein
MRKLEDEIEKSGGRIRKEVRGRKSEIRSLSRRIRPHPEWSGSEIELGETGKEHCHLENGATLDTGVDG